MQHLRPTIVARIVSPTAFGTLALCPSPAWYAWRAALATPDSLPPGRQTICAPGCRHLERGRRSASSGC
jgi:hypothetical protein